MNSLFQIMTMKTYISTALLLCGGCASMFGLDEGPRRPNMQNSSTDQKSGNASISVMYYAPAWGPGTNGEEVVYFLKQVTLSSGLDEQGRIYFCSIKPDGSERREIARLWKDNPDQYFENFIIAVSMDVNAATKRAAIGVELGERGGIFIVNLDGAEFRPLWPKEWKDDRPDKAGCPTWSPDGKWLAFHEYRFRGGSNLYQIVKCRPDASDYTVLTERQASNYEPAWSPRGDFIAYTHFPKFYPGPRYLWLMKPDGSERRGTKVWGGTPRWSPDGSLILYQSQLVNSQSGERVNASQRFPDVFPKWAKSGFLEALPDGISYTPPDGQGTRNLVKNVSRRGHARDIETEGTRW